jgi:transposase
MERSTVHLLHKRGKSLRTIANELGRSKSTIARALSEPVDRQPERRQRTSNVDPFRERIAEWLKQGLSGVRMLELARDDAEHPYRGGSSVWRAAVRRERLNGLHEQAVADVPIRFEGLPGEYLQVDWGEIRHFPFTQQQPVTRYFLACRLKYSRWTWVIFTDNMRQETLFRGLVACFNALGFVPWVLVFDNMKTVTTGRDEHAQPIWHRSLLQLAAEFDFHPEACWPASGNQKGSVESLVKFVKINFLAGRLFINDADLQLLFQVPLLARAQVLVADHQVVLQLGAPVAHLGHLAPTDEEGRVDLLTPLDIALDHLTAGGPGELFELAHLVGHRLAAGSG